MWPLRASPASSASDPAEHLKIFKELLSRYRRLPKFRRPEDPEKAAEMDAVVAHYREVGVSLWEHALRCTEHLSEQERQSELEWIKSKLQAAGYMDYKLRTD
jgi:hypothetical protein